MAKKTPVVTDLNTLKQLVGLSVRPWWQRLLVSFLTINVLTLFGGMTFLYKNYYLFQETVRVVAKMQTIQQVHDDKIHNLEIKQATTDNKISNLEKERKR